MKILVTNDDGIYAKGLWTLVKELRKVSQLVVVAPDREQSAVGTSVTLHQPLRISKVKPRVAGIETYAVEGTPADSVILALGTLIKGEVGLVLSGINEGANLGNDVLISGTVGAALQGYFHGIPAIALSVAALEGIRFDAAAKLAAVLASKVAAKVLPQGILLNVNLPNLPLDKVHGIEVTRLAQGSHSESVQEGHDGKRKYYWIVRKKPQLNPEEGTDKWAIESGRISLTPLHGNLTSAPGVILKDLRLALLQDMPSTNR